MEGFPDWFESFEVKAQRMMVEEKVNEKLKTNDEYKDKVREIDIQIKLLRDKIGDLNYEKQKLKVEYGNKELENMGSKYRMKLKKKDDPFMGMGLFD